MAVRPVSSSRAVYISRGGMEGCKWLHGHVSLEEHRLANIATNLHHCLGPWSPMVLISGSRTGGVDSWGICARAICCMAWEM
eukprot:1022329-Prymnesium_polylepis.1